MKETIKKTHRLVLLALLTACAAPQQLPFPVTQSQAGQPRLSPGTAAISVGKAPHGMAVAHDYLYNANTGDGTISVIDTRSDALVRTLSLPGGKPGYLKASHAGHHLLMLDPAAGRLHVYDPAADHALVQSIAVGAGPDKLQISDDDRKVWVSLSGEAAVAEVAFAEGLAGPATVKTWPVGKGSPDGKGHRALARGLSWLAIPNPGDNDVSLLGPAGESHRIQTGNSPAVLGFGSWDGQDRVLIVGNQASNTLSLVPLDTRQPLSLQNVGQTPTDIAVVPGLNRAFVTMAGSNELAVLDYRQQKLLARIPVGKRPVHVYTAPPTAANGAPELWVCNDAGDSVSVIDPQTMRVSATHLVGKGHHKMAFAGHKAYISSISEGTIHVIPRVRPDAATLQAATGASHENH